MAPVMVLSSVTQACIQPLYQCGKVAPATTSTRQGAMGVNPVSKANYSLLGEERRLQAQFSSQALHLSREGKHARVVSSSRAELAADADKGNVIDVEDAETMEKYIAESGDKLIVVDISTKTCGPCKLIFPKVVKMSKEYPDALFVKINGDHSANTRAIEFLCVSEGAQMNVDYHVNFFYEGLNPLRMKDIALDSLSKL